jgi:hypothetical protein
MLTSPELKKIPVFSCLNDADLMWLSQQAADLHLEPGDYLIHEGEPTPFFVVMDGTTEVLKDVMGRRTEVSEHKRGISSANWPFLWQRQLLPRSARRQLATWHGSIRNTSRN